MTWNETPQAKAILARAKLDTFQRRPDAILPDGTFAHTDERTEHRLEAIRRAHATASVGYTFESTQEPFDRDACARWLDALGPSVETVLTAHAEYARVRGERREAA